MSETEKSQHREIAELERLLAEKKQALAAEGKAIEDREVFQEAYRETFREETRPSISQPKYGTQTAPLTPQELKTHALEVLTADQAQQLNALIEIAFTKGIRVAADVARHATPWLLDQLHDKLQDQYYEKLVQIGKLKAL